MVQCFDRLFLTRSRTAAPSNDESVCTYLETVASQLRTLGSLNPRHGLPCDEVTCGVFLVSFFSFLLRDERGRQRRERDESRIFPSLWAGWLCNLAGRGDSGRGVPEGGLLVGRRYGMGVEWNGTGGLDEHLSIRCLCGSNRSPTVRCMRWDGWVVSCLDGRGCGGEGWGDGGDRITLVLYLISMNRAGQLLRLIHCAESHSVACGMG